MAVRQTGFDVEVSSDGGAGARVRLIGELDLASVAHAEQALARAAGGPSLELDLSSLSFIDSSGLRLLLRLHERAASDGCRLVVRRGPRAVQRILEVTTLERRFEFVD